MCLGYALTWEGGVYSLRNLMLNVVADKVEHCRNHGIMISPDEWCNNQLPYKLVSDQGAEYISDTFTQLTELGVQITNLPPYRPELKSWAELLFRLLQDNYKKVLLLFLLNHLYQNLSLQHPLYLNFAFLIL